MLWGVNICRCDPSQPVSLFRQKPFHLEPHKLPRGLQFWEANVSVRFEFQEQALCSSDRSTQVLQQFLRLRTSAWESNLEHYKSYGLLLLTEHEHWHAHTLIFTAVCMHSLRLLNLMEINVQLRKWRVPGNH